MKGQDVIEEQGQSARDLADEAIRADALKRAVRARDTPGMRYAPLKTGVRIPLLNTNGGLDDGYCNC
jgi:hypothetical protein